MTSAPAAAADEATDDASSAPEPAAPRTDPWMTSTQRIRDLEMPWNRVLGATAGPASAAVALNPWNPQEFMAECVGIVPESGGMMTFVFRRVDGAPLAFRPGQYLRIAFPVDGPDAEPVDRSYSISSAATQPWTFDITVKRDEDGRVSGWVHDNVRPGTVLEMLGPVGAFHLPDAERRPRYLLLAAGSGITPIMSMIRTIHTLPGYSDIVVLYHGTAPGTFAFSRELEYLASVDSRITVYYSLGDRSVDGTWEGMVGRLTTSMIEDVAPDANGRHVYACGPEGYLDVATQLLLDVGVDDTAIHVEYFTGTRDVRLEYKEEVALASELAEEYAEAVQDYHDTQSAALDVFVPSPEAEETPLPEATAAAHAEAPATVRTQDSLDGTGTPPSQAAAETQMASAPAAAADADAASPADFQTVGDGPITMSFVRSKLNVRIGPEERILQVAQRAGVRIGANCQEGMCGSCKSVKLSGEVEMNHQGGIRQREIDAGKFLPCCSTATTDLIIDA